MSNKLEREGGPAFPQEYTCAWAGLTVRDYFAAKAMQGLISQSMGTAMGSPVNQAAEYAYAMADAMLKERDK